jgi:hypothetical protein
VWIGVNLSRRSRLAVAAVAAAALLAACSGDPEPVASPSPSPSPTEEPPPPPAPEPVDPLTGVAPAPGGPLVAVKIDNGPLARPFHRGLDAAGIVYLELVEGGATRLLALYSQTPDLEVGPIRSFRESDIELLQQYGKPGVAFSGANSGVLNAFRRSVQAGQMVEVSYENRPDLYRIGERRRDAKNFFANVGVLAGNAQGAEPARDMGIAFDPAPRPDAAPAGGATVVFSDRETWGVQFDPATGTYALSHNGAALIGVAPVNVIVQQTEIRGSGYRDVTGAVTPATVSVGGGGLHVLRDGTVIAGQWQRPDPGAPTAYVDGAGAPIPLKPGPTWILLQPAGLPFSTA